MRHRAVLVAASLLLATGIAGATWILPPEAPLDRLLANTEKRLEKKPEDPHVLFLLARLHSMAYANPDGEKGRIRAFVDKEDGGIDLFFPMDTVRLHLEAKIDEARLRHLAAAIRLYRLSAEKSDRTKEEGKAEAGLSRFGRAWILEEGSRFAFQAGDPEGGAPKDPLDDAGRADADRKVRLLATGSAEERAAALDALRSSMDRVFPRLLALREDKDPAVRDAIAGLLDARWKDLALAEYRAAYVLTIDAALKNQWRDVMATDLVALQAGEAIERILGLRKATDAEKEEIAGIRKSREEIGKKPHGPVTPILFPVDRPASLASLLPEGRSAVFDLDGDLVPERWPWPSADAGLLVWAPDPAAPITSGRNLVGGRTWWMFWRDGYEPLASLDDDGNGRLEGRELEGLGVWRDRDGDGATGPGEVRSVTDSGIAWIAVRATGTEDGVPANARGLGLRDGSTRPTYDWTPSPLGNAAAGH